MAQDTLRQPIYISSDRRSIVQTLLVGLAVGILGWLLDMAIQRFFIEPVFCRNADSFSMCANGGTIAWVIAIIIASAIGLFSLIRINVFRPLLVVLAAAVTLWGVSGWLGPLVWWQALLWHGALFAVAYLLFVWLARAERFPLAFITTIVVILLLRLVVLSA